MTHRSSLLSRRNILKSAGIGAACSGLTPFFSMAQGASSVLPLDTPGLDHLDIIVPDVEASARFYMALFNTKLHAQPFQGAQRYFILLGELNAGREVGYLAIGASNGRGTYIGHFCTTVNEWRRDSDAIWEELNRQTVSAGLGEFPGASGFGGIFDDPDGIEIQFLPSPDTLVTAAVPSDLAESNAGPVTPLGVNHVILNVSDLDSALDYYRILYGEEAERQGSQAIFEFPRSDTRLILQEIRYSYNTAPGIASFGIKTRPFDRQALIGHLADIGARVIPDAVPAGDPRPASIRFIDPDGIRIELNPV